MKIEMTDRELLELAAKAAGIAGKYADWDDEAGIAVPYPKSQQSICGPIERLWNPLTADGDALRLAVKLDMEVQINRVDRLTVVLTGYTARDLKRTVVEHDQDHYAATRRAIVRAAAEIGKELK